MSEHLLINPEQLYFIYSPKDIKYEYLEFDFLPEYKSFDIETIYDGYKPKGIHEFLFDGGLYSTGIYLYQVKINDMLINKKMIYVK